MRVAPAAGPDTRSSLSDVHRETCMFIPHVVQASLEEETIARENYTHGCIFYGTINVDLIGTTLNEAWSRPIEEFCPVLTAAQKI